MNSSSTYYGIINYIINRRRRSNISSLRQRGNKNKYHRPDLETWSDAKCKIMFRFTYAEICRICKAIKLEKVLQFNNLKVDRELAMAILLYRYSFPRRLLDMVYIFGMSEANIGRTVNGLSALLLKKFKYGLEFDERHFSKENCELFSKAIYEKGAFYPHIVGFIDRTMQQICPKHVDYNKFQAISCPDGITCSLSGPYVNKKNDRGILNERELLTRVAAHFESEIPDKNFAIYGDESYGIAKYMVPPNRQPFGNNHEKETNISMSQVRVLVEMEYSKISRLFNVCKWKCGNKVSQARPGIKYAIIIVLNNIHTCINGSNTASIFGLKSPTLEEYISGLMRNRSKNDIIE